MDEAAFERQLQHLLSHRAEALSGWVLQMALNVDEAPLLGLPPDHWLDGWVMGQPCQPVARVWVAGRERTTRASPQLHARWTEVMQQLVS